MRLEPLYRLAFTYPEEWAVEIAGEGGVEEQHFFIAEGHAQGQINGRFRGANHPRRRTDRTFVPDFQGVIETEGRGTVYVELHGYGRAYPSGRRQIVRSVMHLSDTDAYRRLNDVVCVGVGEVRAGEDETQLVIDIAELVWEPVAE